MPAQPKPRFMQLLVLLAVLAAALTSSPAAAERLRIIPVPPGVVPQWSPIPDLPQVSHAPNLPTDVFRHRGRYFLYWAGAWYQSKKIRGPWTRLENPPAILSRIQTSYFKMLPKGGAQAPGAAPEEGLVTPDGKPVVPPAPLPSQPAAPVSPTPPAGASSPSPPKVTPPSKPAAPQPPETQESAPQAVPEGPMPKAM
jgi:hypothetical protein